MTVERAIRALAGSFVLASLALGYWVHPGFFVFTDVGNVRREDEKILASDLRASAGLGLSWISPVGPLKMSWGKPVKSKTTDRIQQFQFQIGTAF